MEAKEYERVANMFMNSVYRVALNACKSKADAEDIVQNTFEKLWKRDEQFIDDEHIKRWLIRVTINDCNSLFRTAWKKRVISLDEVKELSFSTPEKSDVFYALEKLTLKEREIIHLYYYEEYSIKDIADIINLSQTAIQTRLYRARNKLKEELKGKNHE